ncbi:MAG: hypothetical protein KA436_02780 [Oligoflexales bacterium]|nr:hypothetical protein [Oligoflexales bacterium]
MILTFHSNRLDRMTLHSAFHAATQHHPGILPLFKNSLLLSKLRTPERVILRDDEKGIECQICQQLIEPNQEISTLPCTHRYHSPCLVNYELSTGGAEVKCAICRATYLLQAVKSGALVK